MFVRSCRHHRHSPVSQFPRSDHAGSAWYLRYGLSYRDVDELLAERGVQIDHVSIFIFRWVQRFTPLLAEAAPPCRHRAGDRWWVDETSVKVSGRWRYVYRAIDQFGQIMTCASPRVEMVTQPGASSPARWSLLRSFRWRSPRWPRARIGQLLSRSLRAGGLKAPFKGGQRTGPGSAGLGRPAVPADLREGFHDPELIETH